ncbi:hypothetical protein A2276_02660 [candidate division WOR-1 bacterium RIFOXYA12_FULL_43_27]|uniref:Polysaccharide export protein N-terminal domain-containing protein n=1 Tax=candidate division WOR-1 bacterium RIFOXYC2_FULL_46_14 TaxID=1802587 RepID=A0A1F4U7V9_UNCSA|nr:MAG: hypothetical protein A2276_02660 [candidate division WOR-1 bacterium RIFOXYA12_FULL_43_27]OGC19388.1 MAG: hypothetical protein A2292_01670 [candidate division WOR-1 bacterium RIFOXYB2_FULL_46_45]OGC30377.1 MAG: hypothetical protein A2232_01670 [candidate division WOR-1 bacterium RIFOXYA2_FULL_46_56]OGC40977.1 MAG: hypothetical protein A2438_01670 [candidate division WOR-1 bacterium RIFOXYC2_FULL_46_14]
MKKSICIFLIILNLSLAGEYLLAPGDTLEVKVLGKKDLDTKQTIAPDGTISLPFLGRVEAQGQTLKEFNNNLKSAFSKYIANAQVVVFLTPRPIYVIQHDIKKNVWDVKKAESVDEARAYLGRPAAPVQHGDIVSVNISQKPDWWEDNWYKVLTGAAVAVGIYATVRR